MSLQDANDAELIKYYIETRDYVKADEKAAELRVQPYKDTMAAIEAELQRRLIERGSKNSSTAEGTAYEVELVSPKVADKSAFIDWAVHTGVLLDQTLQAKKETVTTFMDENNGQAPPGIDVTFIRKINIRRS